MVDKNRTAIIKNRYNRIAPMFNIMDKMIKDKWRKALFSKVRGELLEVGVGTGANLPFYHQNAKVTAIDFSPKMLSYARKAAERHNIKVNLLEMDAQNMDFSDNQFDAVVTTCVFCSVPDPIQGLKEIRRVLKPEGRLYMLEHMRSENAFLGKVMDWLNPLIVGTMGANINRYTMDNLAQAGFQVADEKQLMGSIMRELQLKQ